MAATLKASEILELRADELGAAMAPVDIILAHRDDTDSATTLWRRPMDEVIARGMPYKVEIATIHCANGSQLDGLVATVARLKQGK